MTATAEKIVEIGKDAERQNEAANREAEGLIVRYPVRAGEDDPIEFFRTLNEKEGWSLTEVGREVGYDASVVSKVFGGTYNGDLEKVQFAFGDAMNRILGSGRGVLIRTQASLIIEEALADSVASEWFTVLYGESGIGKTDTLRRFLLSSKGRKNARRAIILTITLTASAGSVMQRLADLLGVDSRGQVERLFDRIVLHLKHNPTLIIVDEMNNLERTPSKAARIVNMLRQINDETMVGLVFIGTASLHQMIVDPRNRGWADMLLNRIRLQEELPGASLIEARALLIAHFGKVSLEAWSAWVKGYEDIMRASQREVDLENGNLRAVGVFIKNARYFFTSNRIKQGTALSAKIVRGVWNRCGRRLRDEAA
ncbi:ATP-binding protein [Candidatus Sumerlaeota bacterium]|nr:ATP-binding protein [Candidatus Sumerlaeota bacterium]